MAADLPQVYRTFPPTIPDQFPIKTPTNSQTAWLPSGVIWLPSAEAKQIPTNTQQFPIRITNIPGKVLQRSRALDRPVNPPNILPDRGGHRAP